MGMGMGMLAIWHYTMLGRHGLAVVGWHLGGSRFLDPGRGGLDVFLRLRLLGLGGDE